MSSTTKGTPVAPVASEPKNALSLKPDESMKWIYDPLHPEYDSDRARDLRDRRAAALRNAPQWMIDAARLPSDPPVQPTEPHAELIEAAEQHLSNFDGQTEPLCRADILNAFFAGSKFATPVQPTEPVGFVTGWHATGTDLHSDVRLDIRLYSSQRYQFKVGDNIYAHPPVQPTEVAREPSCYLISKDADGNTTVTATADNETWNDAIEAAAKLIRDHGALSNYEARCLVEAIRGLKK